VCTSRGWAMHAFVGSHAIMHMLPQWPLNLKVLTIVSLYIAEDEIHFVKMHFVNIDITSIW